MSASNTQYWMKTLSKFLSVQLFVQALSFGSGILIIRTLSKEEYAYFAIANSLQATMNILADSGIGIALDAIGGKVWQDHYRFGQLINTAMYLRQHLAVIAVIVVTPILFLMLHHAGASVSYTVILIIGVLIELYCYLQMGVLSSVLRLKTQITRIQKLALIGGGCRLVILTALFKFLNAGIGIFASTIASITQSIILNAWVKDSIDRKAPVNQEDRGEIIKFIGKQIPNSVLYAVEGQLGIWLISIFGNTENIAELGALTRLGVIFGLISSVLNEIILPSFSRCQVAKILFKRYMQVLGLYCLFSFLLIILAFFFPSQSLWILGENYSHLKEEVLLLVISFVVQYILGVAWLMNVSKGWILSGWIAVPIEIITKIVLLLFIDVSSLNGIFLFNILSNIPVCAKIFYVAYFGFKKMNFSQLT
ncbi:polysaccharide biosynthesis protein [Picosynechococcus sp. PCC 73109]|nr:polysaccharide biosynthesis protein [Picosynechococcus sp. PCC 73109]